MTELPKNEEMHYANYAIDKIEIVDKILKK